MKFINYILFYSRIWLSVSVILRSVYTLLCVNFAIIFPKISYSKPFYTQAYHILFTGAIFSVLDLKNERKYARKTCLIFTNIYTFLEFEEIFRKPIATLSLISFFRNLAEPLYFNWKCKRLIKMMNEKLPDSDNINKIKRDAFLPSSCL